MTFEDLLEIARNDEAQLCELQRDVSNPQRDKREKWWDKHDFAAGRDYSVTARVMEYDRDDYDVLSDEEFAALPVRLRVRVRKLTQRHGQILEYVTFADRGLFVELFMELRPVDPTHREWLRMFVREHGEGTEGILGVLLAEGAIDRAHVRLAHRAWVESDDE